MNGLKAVVDEEGEKLGTGFGEAADGFAKKSVKKTDRKWAGLGEYSFLMIPDFFLTAA